MKFCINSLMLPTNLDIFKKIKIVSRNKFVAIEPWIDELQFKNSKDIVKCCEDYNIQIPAVQQLVGWFENDGELMGVSDNHKDIIDECKRRMELSASVNAKWIVVTPAFSHRNHFGSWQQGIDYFNEILELGKSIGCLPSIEFMGQTKQIDTFLNCKKFIDNVNAEGTMIIDSYHLWKSGGETDDFLGYDKNKISVLHISDADKNINREMHMDRNRVMPLDGQIDLHKFSKTAKSIAFDGFVNAGVYNKKLWEYDPDHVCKDLYDRMKLIFD